ncbi:MAG: hypothetical protein HYU36_15065 [Planctomycetes bacterium]|nr:hypothetical protein [Planctomycetota bacterium]
MPRLLAACAGLLFVPAFSANGEVLDGLLLRARVARMDPADPVRIFWRWGGEGLGGSPVRGEFTAVLPGRPDSPQVAFQAEAAEEEGIANDAAEELLSGPKPKGMVVREGKTFTYLYLEAGTWSPAIPLSAFKSPRPLFLTVTLEGLQHGALLRSVEVEFQLLDRGKEIKRFHESGDDGGTVGLFLPLDRLRNSQDPRFTEAMAEVGGLSDYARRRAERLEALPWSGRPVPERFGFLTDLSGYGQGAGYGIRHTSRAVIDLECRALRTLGVNGLRACPPFLREQINRRAGPWAALGRIAEVHGMGYPVPAVRRSERTGRISESPEGAGCPFHPGTARRTQEGVQHALEQALSVRAQEVWSLTVDEIGSVFDLSPEGKGHASVCPHCLEGFRAYLRAQGLTPQDFGAVDWQPIRPNAYTAAASTETEQPQFDRETPLGPGPAEAAPPDDLDTPDLVEEPDARTAVAPGQHPDTGQPGLPDRGQALLRYWSRQFNNTASAQLFRSLRDAFARENQKKQEALARGDTSGPAASQPWVRSFSLRGNTFLLGGHSLDFFDFYRYADNGFCYETSNRDPRVWSWDSYLCDIGRNHARKWRLGFGVYVKPHRGAPLQRILSALSRKATWVFLYTYGHDYWKGDSFSSRPDCLEAISRAARLVARAESVLYGADWAISARIGVVRTRTSEYLGSSASWENGKWIYTALAHEHFLVDALDEVMLAEDDLSPYSALYVSGSHVTRKAAVKLGEWVRAGGILYTSGWGLARDEADQPFDDLLPILGLEERSRPEIWTDVRRYGATALNTFGRSRPIPDGAEIRPAGDIGIAFKPLVGREVLLPCPGTEVLARFADGGAALTRHPCGHGAAFVAGFFPGLEYAAAVHRNDFDMSRDFNPQLRAFVTAPALAVAQPAVQPSQPAVEAILLQNPQTGKRAVTLLNWTYRGNQLVSFENLKITIRSCPGVTRVLSAWREEAIPVHRQGDELVLTCPLLDEADVLLLE